MEVSCQDCGHNYSMLNHTVCPKCFAWPKLKSRWWDKPFHESIGGRYGDYGGDGREI